MDIRVLRYFLAVARCKNITRASEELHITQPNLSRQLTELEEELGASLLIRGKRSTELTEAGLLLKARAMEIISLTEKTKEQFENLSDTVAGDVYFGCGETFAMEDVAKVLSNVNKIYPQIHYHFKSGDGEMVYDELQKGLISFGLVCRSNPPLDYEYCRLPYEDTWGVILRKDNPLAQHNEISKEDLSNEPLFISRQALGSGDFKEFLTKLNVVGTYNLAYNMLFMVATGLGSMLVFKNLAEVSVISKDLVFKPLKPIYNSYNYIIWKRDQHFTKAEGVVADHLKTAFLNNDA